MDKVTSWADLHESPSDETLMDAYVRGDTAALERLYERWSDRLFGYLARALDPITAEELFRRSGCASTRRGSPIAPAVPSRRGSSPSLRIFGVRSSGGGVGTRATAAGSRAVGNGPVRRGDRAGGGATERGPASARRTPECTARGHRAAPVRAPLVPGDSRGARRGVEAVKSRAFRGYKALRVMLAEMQP